MCPYEISSPLHFFHSFPPLIALSPSSALSVLALSLGHLISLPLPLWLPEHKAQKLPYAPFIPLLPPSFSLRCPILNPSLRLPSLSLLLSLSLSLSLSSFPSQRLIHSRMALFPPQPSDNIKIQNGQLNPSSISDLIVMVLPPVPGRPLPPRQPSLYDTKWPGYNFSIYSKNSVNNSFGMSRRDSQGRLRPGPSPLRSQGSRYTGGKKRKKRCRAESQM